MGLGMAAMFAPAEVLPTGVGVAVFGAVGAWFAGRAVQARRAARPLVGDCAVPTPAAAPLPPPPDRPLHHVVAAAAMVLMLLAHAPVDAGALGHAHAAPVPGPLALLALPLAAWFVWCTLRCADLLVHPDGAHLAGSAADGAVVLAPLLVAVRLVTVAHVVMGAAMTVMLLTVV